MSEKVQESGQNVNKAAKPKNKKEENVLKIIELGKSKGVITYKEITDILDDTELKPEQLEKLYDVLEDMNIDIIDEDIEKELPKLESEAV